MEINKKAENPKSPKSEHAMSGIFRLRYRLEIQPNNGLPTPIATQTTDVNALAVVIDVWYSKLMAVGPHNVAKIAIGPQQQKA